MSHFFLDHSVTIIQLFPLKCKYRTLTRSVPGWLYPEMTKKSLKKIENSKLRGDVSTFDFLGHFVIFGAQNELTRPWH